MKRTLAFTALSIVVAAVVTAARAAEALPSFPGAEGFGAESVGAAPDR